MTLEIRISFSHFCGPWGGPSMPVRRKLAGLVVWGWGWGWVVCATEGGRPRMGTYYRMGTYTPPPDGDR